MKNHRILMLIVVCAVLDWFMVSSSREQERRMVTRQTEYVADAPHKMGTRDIAVQILAQRAAKRQSVLS